MSGSDQPLLFVYGSLRPCENHPMGERLRSQASLLGAATMQGRLYAISWYPGIIDSVDPADLVRGDVFTLSTPETTLAWLDQYEGIVQGPGSVAPNAEYARVGRSVRLVDGRDLEAWVYLFRQSTAGRRRIVCGDWSQRSRTDA